jgi:hypothetical protein
MATLEQDFPELKEPRRKSVRVFPIGQQPPEWTEWQNYTMAQRWRYGEMLRRIAFGYDPDAPQLPPYARVVRRGER